MEECRETAWGDDLKEIRQEIEKKPQTGEEQIWRFFKRKGLNDYAVAGIMGNLYAESGTF